MKTVQRKYTKRNTSNKQTSNTDIQLPKLFQMIISEEKQTSEKNETTSNKFEQLLAEAIDESFSSLGSSAKHAIYYHLENLFNIKKSEIPYKIEEFTIAIEDIFGEGAQLLEIQMMKCLHQKVGTPFKQIPMKDELVFTDYMLAHKML